MKEIILFSILLAGLVLPESHAGPSVQPPNILLVLADNWGQHAGAYGTEIVKTPHFDRVAREGALFTHAFCPVPSCTPTRRSRGGRGRSRLPLRCGTLRRARAPASRQSG